MRQRGFSLIETVLVVTILAILTGVAVPVFTRLLTHYRIESQTRGLLADLQQTRANALYQRRVTRVKLYPARYEVYSSSADSGAPLRSSLLRYPLSVEEGATIDFNERGIALTECSICVDSAEPTGALDSVVVAKTRLSIGQREPGHDCNATYITKR